MRPARQPILPRSVAVVVFFATFAHACTATERLDPALEALDAVGLPAASLDRATAAGAPAIGAADPVIDVVAFLDPVDPPSRKAFGILARWVDAEADVRVSVRLRPLPVHPPSRALARRWRALAPPAYFEAWRGRAVTSSASAAGDAALAADETEARRLDVRRVPTVFINGFRLSGPHPLENYRAVAERFREALTPLIAKRGAPERTAPHAATPGAVDALVAKYARTDVPRPPEETVPRRTMRPEQDTPVRGAKTPLVTIMFFADLACPHSRRMWKTLKTLVRTNPDVQVRFRHRPLASFSRSKVAARAAIAASLQGRFWPMVERLFRAKTHSEKDLRRIARQVGLDVARFDRDRQSKPVFDKLDDDRRTGDRLGFKGTPVLSINGVRLIGDQPSTIVEDRIASERERARALLKAGVSRDGLQVETVRRDAGQGVGPAPRRRRPTLRGPEKSPPRVAVFADATCAYSAAALDAVRRAYADQDVDVRVYYAPRDVPFARAAAELAAELESAQNSDGSAALWRSAGQLDGATLRAIRARLAGSTARARQAKRRVDRDLRTAWRAGVVDVPAVFVDGVPVNDPLDVRSLRSALATVVRNETVKQQMLETVRSNVP